MLWNKINRILLCLSFLSLNTVNSQNLVLNGSFETANLELAEWWRCPNVYAMWPASMGNLPYEQFASTPDLYNTLQANYKTIPLMPLAAKHGNSFFGITSILNYDDSKLSENNAKYEYIGLKINPLIVGRKYECKFYTTIGMTRITQDGLWKFPSHNGLCVNLSTNKLVQKWARKINVNSVWKSPKILNDSVWEESSFTFIADSSYEYINFGIFRPISELNADLNQYFFPKIYSLLFYMYLDDVSIIDISNNTKINQKKIAICEKEPIKLYNVDNDSVNWYINNVFHSYTDTLIYYPTANCMVTMEKYNVVDTCFVTVNPIPTYNLVILDTGCNINLKPTSYSITNCVNCNYYWLPEKVNSLPYITLNNSFSKVIITNNFGCIDSSLFNPVFLCNKKPTFYFPNAIYLNSRYGNHSFKINDESILNVNFNVYNRWGGKIKQYNGKQIEWIPNQLLPEGVYIWTANIEYVEENRKMETFYKGSFHLFK